MWNKTYIAVHVGGTTPSPVGVYPDRQLGRPGVETPLAVHHKYPRASEAGPGSGYSRPITNRSIREAVRVVDITYMEERWELGARCQKPLGQFAYHACRGQIAPFA